MANVQASLVTMSNNVVHRQAWSEALTADTASTEAMSKDDIDEGNNVLRIDTDTAVWIDVGENPDGSEQMFLAVPNYPLLIKAQAGHKVAYAAVA